MKTVACSLIAACLLAVGCKGTAKKDEGPKLPPVAAAKPAGSAALTLSSVSGSGTPLLAKR